MPKLCDCDTVPLEQHGKVVRERDDLRTHLKAAEKTIRDLMALHNPKEASSYDAQRTMERAGTVAAALLELQRASTSNGANGHSE